MLSRFDDYPIHQTPDPIAVPASSDKDVYERYFFNGYSRGGELYFGVAAAYYPHLGIKDASISLVVAGEQHSFHASARAAGDPSEMRVGPFVLDIVEPMRSCRIVLDADHPDNDTGWGGELMFEGRTGNVEEPRHVWPDGLRRLMDTTRFTQLGRWSGWLRYGDETIELDGAETCGTKDRSWGIRPLAGGDQRGAPALPRTGGLFFIWAPIHFDDICVHYQRFEDTSGLPMYSVGALLPTYLTLDALPGIEDPAARVMHQHEHRLQFAADSRMIESATLAFTAVDDGSRHQMEMEKLFTFRMKGIGYSHPEWGHGQWRDEMALGTERWALADVDDTAYENQHVQHLMRVTMGDRAGIGILEQNILGPYEPYGLTGFIDPPG